MYKLTAWLLLMPGVLGCSGQAKLLDEPVAFSGMLTDASGAPVSDVLLTLQPLENGHPVLLEVDSSGKFQGAGVPGEYAYFVGASAKSSSKGNISVKRPLLDFLEARMDRTIRIENSSELNVELR